MYDYTGCLGILANDVEVEIDDGVRGDRWLDGKITDSTQNGIHLGSDWPLLGRNHLVHDGRNKSALISGLHKCSLGASNRRQRHSSVGGITVNLSTVRQWDWDENARLWMCFSHGFP